MNFENLKLSEQLKKAIARMGFKKPTQIQNDTIPLILSGKDIIGESATGSGKTLAFGAGVVEKVIPGKGIQALILVPTRELAEQVKDEIIKISHGKKMNILAIYGGVAINPQMDKLRRADVVVATPGRLLDHLTRETIDVSNVKIIVLDEADRMVEMGFIEDVEKIIQACPTKRQTLLFSATMYGLTKKIIKKHMNSPTTIHATKMVDPEKLKQFYYEVPGKLKKELLVHLLKENKKENNNGINLTMVFCNTRRETDVVVEVLRENGIKTSAIHGGMTQTKRLKTIELFNKGKFNVLVCTDVAARGLHIEGVSYIYNYDIPRDANDYVHRIGRTARAGKKGVVINILSRRDFDNFSRVLETHRTFDIVKKERPYLKEIKNNSRDYSKKRTNPWNKKKMSRNRDKKYNKNKNTKNKKRD